MRNESSKLQIPANNDCEKTSKQLARKPATKETRRQASRKQATRLVTKKETCKQIAKIRWNNKAESKQKCCNTIRTKETRSQKGSSKNTRKKASKSKEEANISFRLVKIMLSFKKSRRKEANCKINCNEGRKSHPAQSRKQAGLKARKQPAD